MKRIIKINKDYNNLRDFVNSVPNIFKDKGDFIYDARNQIKIFNIGEDVICVKRFKVPIFINRFVYGYFRKSKAKRSYENSSKMIEMGFDSPTPIAYIEEYNVGLFSESYYLCEYSEYPSMFRDFENLKDISAYEDVISLAGKYIARMHNAGVYHKDLSIGNILFKKEDGHISFTIIDTNRMSFSKVSAKNGYKGLERLRGNDSFIKLLAYSYAQERGFDKEEAYKKINALIQKSDIYFRKKAIRKNKNLKNGKG